MCKGFPLRSIEIVYFNVNDASVIKSERTIDWLPMKHVVYKLVTDTEPSKTLAFDPVGLRATWTTMVQDWDVYEDRKILSVVKHEPWVRDVTKFVLKVGPGRDFREHFLETMDLEDYEGTYPDFVRGWVTSRLGCLSEL